MSLHSIFNTTIDGEYIPQLKGAKLLSAAFYDVLHPHKLQNSLEICAITDQTFLQYRNFPLGMTYMALGVLYLACYIPCTHVMRREHFLQHSCYKIMFAMAIVDIITVLHNSILTGYLQIIGASACTHPLTTHYGGSIGLALWCCYCCQAVLLGASRCIDMALPDMGTILFKGDRTWLWLLVPTLYGVYFFVFEPPPLFHPFLAAWFFDVDPFTSATTNFMHAFNNVVCTGIVVILNIFMSYYVFKMMKKVTDKVSKTQIVTIIQCLLICSSMMIASIIYVLMQFVGLPVIFTVISQLLWQFSNGGPGIMYLVVNQSLRNGVINLFASKENRMEVSFGPKSGGARRSSVAPEGRASISTRRLAPIKRGTVA